MDCWIKRSPNPDLRKVKLVFSPIYFLFHFERFIGIKKVLGQFVKVRITLWLGEEIKEERKKGRKVKTSPRTYIFGSGTRGW